MKWRSRVLIAASLGLSISAGIGCPSANDPSAIRNVGGTGSVGQNGLKPCAYTKYQGYLTTAMGRSLTGLEKDADWKKYVHDTDEGPTFERFMIECALQPNETALGDLSLTGRGLLAAQSGISAAWLAPNGRLSPEQRQDIYTCLAMRTNLIDKVNVWMDGADITDDPNVYVTNYKIIEGYWGTLIDSASGKATVYYFLPPNVSKKAHGARAVTPYYERICSEAKRARGECPFSPVVGGACTGDPKTGWVCRDDSKQPPLVVPNAVQTRVNICVCCKGEYTAPGLCDNDDGQPLTCPSGCPTPPPALSDNCKPAPQP